MLSVSRHMKQYHPEVQIYAMFFTKDKERILRANYPCGEVIHEILPYSCFDLSDLLPRFVRSVLFQMRRLSKKYPVLRLNRLEDFGFKLLRSFVRARLRRWITSIKPDLCLSDSWNNAFYQEVKKQGIKVVGFTSIPSFSIRLTDEGMDLVRKQKAQISHYDLFLADTPQAAKFFLTYESGVHVHTVGIPRFDGDWINYVLKKLNASQQLSAGEKARTILVLLKNETSLVFREHSFVQLLQEILDVSRNLNYKNIILKPHPQQNMHLVKKIVLNNKDLNISIMREPIFFLVERACVVVSMPSGGIFDGLIMEKPVIEYFNYKNLTAHLREMRSVMPKDIHGGLGVVTARGDLTSVFRHRNLVIAADSPAELREAILTVTQKDRKVDLNNIREYFYMNSAQRITEILLAQAANSNNPFQTGTISR